MKDIYKDILIGMCEDGEFVFISNVGVRDWNCKNEFTVVFETLEPRICDDKAVELEVESRLDYFDKDYKYDLCEQFDCAPSELKQNLMEEITVEDIFDYNETWSEQIEVTKEGDEYDVYMCFSMSTPKSFDYKIVEFANEHIKELFELINKLGKEYHLKEIPQDIWENLATRLEMYEGMDTFKEDLKFIEDRLKF